MEKPLAKKFYVSSSANKELIDAILATESAATGKSQSLLIETHILRDSLPTNHNLRDTMERLLISDISVWQALDTVWSLCYRYRDNPTITKPVVDYMLSLLVGTGSMPYNDDTGHISYLCDTADLIIDRYYTALGLSDNMLLAYRQDLHQPQGTISPWYALIALNMYWLDMTDLDYIYRYLSVLCRCLGQILPAEQDAMKIWELVNICRNLTYT